MTVGLQRHPAAIDLFIAEHHGIGDEGFVTERQQAGNQALRRGNLRIAADLGAEQAIPEWA